uniref:Uncharacterized protein MANES_16G025200 n=1 Tax=Rhizophora mucronata TaxID=61149 RepID=A0A2P2LLA2_RHIMU
MSNEMPQISPKQVQDLPNCDLGGSEQWNHVCFYCYHIGKTCK